LNPARRPWTRFFPIISSIFALGFWLTAHADKTALLGLLTIDHPITVSAASKAIG
jgi:hypothetical protein